MGERLGVERSYGVEAERAQRAGRQVAIALMRGNAEQRTRSSTAHSGRSRAPEPKPRF